MEERRGAVEPEAERLRMHDEEAGPPAEDDLLLSGAARGRDRPEVDAQRRGDGSGARATEPLATVTVDRMDARGGGGGVRCTDLCGAVSNLLRVEQSNMRGTRSGCLRCRHRHRRHATGRGTCAPVAKPGTEQVRPLIAGDRSLSVAQTRFKALGRSVRQEVRRNRLVYGAMGLAIAIVSGLHRAALG